MSFVAPSEYRPALADTAAGLSRLVPGSQPRERRRRKVIARLLERADGNGRQRFILSEENLIGTPDRILRGNWLYDMVGPELKPTLDAFRGRPLRVLLAIRNYADFFPSAYVEAIKLGHFIPFEQPLADAFLSIERGWPDIIAEIRAALPDGAELLLWQYEAMRTDEERILSAFVGPDVAARLEPLEGRPQQGAAARAIAHLNQLAARGMRISRTRVRKVLKDSPKSLGHAPFDPWSREERQYLSERYDRDLLRIAESWPGAMIHAPIFCASGDGTGQTGQPKSA